MIVDEALGSTVIFPLVEDMTRSILDYLRKRVHEESVDPALIDHLAADV